MRAVFYNFNKRKNSTKQPAVQGTVKDVQLKDVCTIINPVLVIQENPSQYNYVYIPEFARYYFVTNWAYVLGRWEISLAVDVLASFKGSILEQSANILYADSSTKNIVDQRIPVKADVSTHVVDKALDGITITGYANQGAVMLGITGVGSFGVYLMSDSALVSDLLDGVDNWAADKDMIKQFFFGGSAAQNLKSAIALPILLGSGDVGGSAVPLTLGNYPAKYNDIAITGTKVTKPILTKVTDISIPWQNNDWRRNPPYTNVYLYLPFIGLMSMPTADMINDSTLAVQYSINVTSGDLSIQVRGKTSNRIFATASTNIAMAIAYGSAGIDTAKITSAITAGAGAVIAGASAIVTGGLSVPAVLGIGGGLAAAAGGTLSGIAGNTAGSGGLGGGSSQGLDRVMHCYVVTRELTDSPNNFNAIMGKPYFGVNKLKNFEGFVMTEGFSIDEGLSDQERNTINSMCDIGIYVE